jgi:hypothetical protein
MAPLKSKLFWFLTLLALCFYFSLLFIPLVMTVLCYLYSRFGWQGLVLQAILGTLSIILVEGSLKGSIGWDDFFFLSLSLCSFILMKTAKSHHSLSTKNLWNILMLRLLLPCCLLVGAFSLQRQGQQWNYVGKQVYALLKTLPDVDTKLKEMVASGVTEAQELLTIFTVEQEFLERVIYLIPSYLIAGFFIQLWCTIFLLSRLIPYWKDSWFQVPWRKWILEYENPLFFLYPVILGLSLFLVGGELFTTLPWLSAVIWHSIFNIFGVAYFFQGFAVLLHLLDFWGIPYYLRPAVVAINLLFFWWLIPIIGLLDSGVDFRHRWIHSVKS